MNDAMHLADGRDASEVDASVIDTNEKNRRGFLKTSATAAGLVLGGASAALAKSPLYHSGTGAKTGSGTGSKSSGISAAKTKKPTLPNLYPGWNAKQFSQIRADEVAHVQLLVGALGSQARPAPNFKNLEMPDIVTFAQTSYVLENTGVSAYLGAAPYINSKAYLSTAGAILGIEARHSGYLGVLLNSTMDLFAPLDQPATIPIVMTNAAPFLVDLNGGPPLDFSTTPSDMNDIAILNFALALEYLEAMFYEINVAKFFGV